jgi:hypothetical protein
VYYAYVYVYVYTQIYIYIYIYIYTHAHRASVIRVLLEAGADMLVKDPISGDSALHVAAYMGKYACMYVYVRERVCVCERERECVCV